MLTDNERKIMEILRERQIVTKEEINRVFRTNGDGVSLSFNRLVEMGYVEKIESLGTCYVITQEGSRAMKVQ
jgi:uncharacterized membrane protein